MARAFEFERRDFLRLPVALQVRYKFLSRQIEHPELKRLHEGITRNLGAGGMQLSCNMPEAGWMAELLTRRMYVGINLMLPRADRPVKALCRCTWASALHGETDQAVLGLEFQEITSEDRDLVTRYMIKAQLEGSR